MKRFVGIDDSIVHGLHLNAYLEKIEEVFVLTQRRSQSLCEFCYK